MDKQNTPYRIVRRTSHTTLEEYAGAGLGYMPRAMVAADVWEVINSPLLTALWTQRERAKLPRLRRTFPLPLERCEGKEALLLFWGAERAGENLATVIANWRGLAPEERWWLVTQADATRGRAEYSPTRGWRQAIYHILVENPAG
jgi:hypothetical protein